MATIFLSYRRTDSPQACRVYDWLGQRFGLDALFMDVQAIPVAVSFPDFIRKAIERSKLVIVLIGPQWLAKIHEADDPVRLEIEAAIAHKITLLPVLIGSTPMPDGDELPHSIGTIALQNAAVVGVSFDFHSHMKSLSTRIEGVLGTLAQASVITSDPTLIKRACEGIIYYLQQEFDASVQGIPLQWSVVGTTDFPHDADYSKVTLFLHRVTRLVDLLELHFVLSFWARNAGSEQTIAGFVFRQFERNPIVPEEFLVPFGSEPPLFDVRVRWSDEDARQVWRMITDQPLRLSLACVATLAPKQRG
jgi:hypothetical protein